MKLLACRILGHRWYDASFITWKGGRKGTQKCSRCERASRPFVAFAEGTAVL